MKRRWIIWGSIILIVILVILVAVTVIRSGSQQSLASLQTQAAERGSLTASIGATGTIQARQQAALAFAISGRVKDVNIQLGQKVKEGEVLIALDPAYFPQQVISAAGDLPSAQKSLNDLKRSNTSTAQAELDLINARETAENAKQAYDNAVDTYEQGSLKHAQDRFDLAEAQYNYWRRQPVNNFTDQIRLQQKYREYILATQEMQKAQAEYDAGARGGTEESQKQLDLAKAKYEVAKARQDDAQARFDSLSGGIPASDLAAAQARVDAAQSAANQTRIVAPFSGTILAINLLPGDLVSPGIVAVVVADISELHVDVPIAEVDYNRVRMEQPAELVLDANVGTTYHGLVREIEMSSLVTGGTVSYPVKVVLTDADSNVLPGMTVAVSIEVSRLDDVLMVPNRAVRAIDGIRVVYILDGGSLVQVKITLGASNDTMSEVVGGELKAGDLVVLNPPSSFFSGNSSAGPGRMQGMFQ
jgi:HlyD family secretion protein